MDTSAFYAAVDRGDSAHVRAVGILRTDEPLLTTDHVLIEAWLLIQRRMDGAVAERFWAGVRSSATSVEPAGPADLEAAWSIGQAFVDQGFSIVDRTSFAVMQRLGIVRVASFDDDFAIFRYGARRERAFEVVR